MRSKELMQKHRKKFFILFVLATILSNLFDPVVSSDNGGSKHNLKFSFFPYECCVLLEIQSIRFDSKIDKDIVSAKVLESINGPFHKGESLNLCFRSALNEFFEVKKLDELVGRKEVMAFNLLEHEQDKNFFLIDHEFLPLKSQPTSQHSIRELRKKIPKPCFPYRSCLIVQIVHYSEEPQEAVVKMRIERILAKDQKFPVEDYSAVSKKIMTEVCPRMEHYDFRLGEEIVVKIDATALSNSVPLKFRENCVGKNYVLCWNPKLDSESKLSKNFIAVDSTRLISQKRLKEEEVSKIKAEAKERSVHLKILTEQLQNHIENRWTLDRVREFIKHPELREVAPFRHIDLSREAILGGQIYSDHKNEIGELIWFTSLKQGIPVNDYLLNLTDKAGHKWVLETKKFDLEQFTNHDFEKELLLLIIRRSYQTYVQVRWNKPFELRIAEPIEIIELTRSEKKLNRKITCKLGNGKILTADMNPDYQLQNILVNGRENADWKEAYNKRVENMNRLWEEWSKKNGLPSN